MPEAIGLDEIPGIDPFDTDNADKEPCPECGRYFKPSGIKRHITVAHGSGQSSSGTRIGKKRLDIAVRWSEFQIGASLLVSFACNQCAAALAEDAQKDGDAIARYCENKPKLRKQVEQFLTTTDMLVLVGALGGTAQKMVSHHSIGKKIGLPGATAEHGHGARGMEGMAKFMSAMPEDARNALINDALNVMANGGQPMEVANQALVVNDLPTEPDYAEHVAERVANPTRDPVDYSTDAGFYVPAGFPVDVPLVSTPVGEANPSGID